LRSVLVHVAAKNSGLLGTWWGEGDTREHQQKETEGRFFVWKRGWSVRMDEKKRRGEDQVTNG
jgi:hypothetical protein